MRTHLRRLQRATREHINVHDDYDVRFWTRELGCTAGELHAAVFAVGSPVENVRDHLALMRAKRSRNSKGSD